MPHIEIHGVERQAFEAGSQNYDAIELRVSIFRLFENKPFCANLVVSICPDLTVDPNGTVQPFLRIISTPNKHFTGIVKTLVRFAEQNKLDVEVMELKSFHSKYGS